MFSFLGFGQGKKENYKKSFSHAVQSPPQQSRAPALLPEERGANNLWVPPSLTEQKLLLDMPSQVAGNNGVTIKEDSSEGEFDKSERQLEAIKNEYMTLKKKYHEIQNKGGKSEFLELEEKLSRLVFRLDDVEVGNNVELKTDRRETLKAVQDFIEFMQQKKNNPPATNIEDVEEMAQKLKDMFKFEKKDFSNMTIYYPPPVADESEPMDCSPPACDEIASSLREYQNSVSDLKEVPAIAHAGINKAGEEVTSQRLKQITLKQKANPEGPLQLLHMNKDTGLFELDEAAVKSVLMQPQVKNRKIAIVSIVGAFRRGKSFLLNFMLRYLNAQGSPNWLEQIAKVEGFSWRGGMERDTTGILMWPQPFLVGDDLAVVLLDTQGTFDKHASMKENTFIFALSTLLSSVQIYNLHERIQMDDLNNLKYFLEFGRMVQDTSNSKVFGNLVFLIRDWKFEMERAFGFDGGKELLLDWQLANGSTENLTEAKMIDVCFDQIKCFLMPHPGDHVSRDPHFTGNLSDIKPEFLAHLKHFIESIFKRGILSGKQIGGEFVNAEQFLMYMTTYVDKLQHPDIEPKTLFQSMCDTSHSQVVSQCKESYMREMQRAVREVTCDIQAAHQHAVDAALALYASTPKFGALCDNNLYKKKLVQVLEESYERFAHEFERQVESKLKEACTSAYDNYQATLNAFCMQLEPECSLEIKSIEACKQAVETLKNLKIRITGDKFTQEIETLQKRMKTYYKTQEPFFKARQEHELNSQRKNLINSIKQDVVKCYQAMMDTYCGGAEIVKEFDGANTRAQFKAINMLQNEIKNHKILNSTDLVLEVDKEIEVICENYRKHNERKIQKEKEQQFKFHMAECRHKAIERYRQEMDEKCGGLKTIENIQDLHQYTFRQTLDSVYSPHVKIYKEEACKPFICKTQENMETIFAQYSNANAEKLKQNTRAEAEGLYNIGLSYYEEKMQKLKIGSELVKNLPEIHEKIKAEALNMLAPVTGTEIYKKCMEKLQQKIAIEFDHYKQVNTAKDKQLRLDHMKEVKDKSIQCYVEKMDGLEIDKKPVEKIKDKHTSFKTEALSLLNVLKDNKEDIKTATSLVNKEIDKKWQLYKNQNEKMTEIFKNDALRTVKCAYNEMKAEYVTNMNKNMNANLDTKDVTQLFKFHEQEKKRVLTTFKLMTKECDTKSTEESRNKLTSDIQKCFDGVEQAYGKNIRDLRIKELQTKNQSTKNYAIGIDLGTTNCCAAVYKDGKVEIIKNGIDKTTTPSVVCFKENDEIVFGDTAVVAGFGEPEHCVSEMKRIIGRRFDDPVVQSLIGNWPFKVTVSNKMPVINIQHGHHNKSYKPEEVSSLVLGEMKKIAEVYLGSQVHDAVVTIPAYFNELQREATKAACVKAGLNVLRMINEPTAAAIAYGLQCKSEAERTILVFDFGGGTCDISIMELEGTDFVVKASKGDNKLGGEDFDDRLTDHVTKIIEQKYNVKIDAKARRRLRYRCERAKKTLSEQQECKLESEDFRTENKKIDIDITIDKQVFENITKDLLQKALIPVKQCLNEAGLQGHQINEIVLVGGSSRMPRIQQMLRDFFEGKEMKIRINPDEAIAYGAAIQAAICTGEYKGYINIADITPISLGIGVKGDRMSIITPKNTQIPSNKTQYYVTIADNQTVINIRVYQGEHTEDEYKNTKIGDFDIDGLTPAPEGVTGVDVTFNIDADGILKVTAVERGKSGNKKSRTIHKTVM